MSKSLWPAPWVRAGLRLAILGCLVEEGKHGYAITSELAERGFGKVAGGSLYPHLMALEESGQVHATWLPADSGPKRKQYHLTELGRQGLVAGLAELDDLRAALAKPLETSHSLTARTQGLHSDVR